MLRAEGGLARFVCSLLPTEKIFYFIGDGGVEMDEDEDQLRKIDLA